MASLSHDALRNAQLVQDLARHAFNLEESNE
jgi:hypothetical protein